MSRSCQLHLPPSLLLASTIHPMGPGPVTGPRAPYSPFSCWSDFQSVGSSHSSCQSGFPSFRVNSKGPSACSFPSVCVFLLPYSHRALSLRSFRLLLQGLFLWAACSDRSIGKKVASTTITSCPILPHGACFPVISLRAGTWSQPRLYPHHLQLCLAHLRYSENHIYWMKIWINIRPFVFINTNSRELSEVSTIIIAEETSTHREIHHVRITQWKCDRAWIPAHAWLPAKPTLSVAGCSPWQGNALTGMSEARVPENHISEPCSSPVKHVFQHPMQ